MKSKFNVFKALTLLLCALFFVLSFAGCGHSDDDNLSNEKSSVVDGEKDSSEKKKDKKNKKLKEEETEETTEPEVHGEAFFNDAVFVGDSVTLGLRNYVKEQRNSGASCLGSAEFLCAGSMGWTNTLRDIGTKDSMHPKYQGDEVTIADGVKLIGAKKVFILLGMNDIGIYSNEETIENVKSVIGQILNVNPDVKIFIQSITPVIASRSHGNFANSHIDEVNGLIKELCEENNWTFVDVASQLKDSDNCLALEYCSDPDDQGMHMERAGCQVWIDYLVNNF